MKLYYRICAEKRVSGTLHYVQKWTWLFWNNLDRHPLYGRRYFASLEAAMAPIYEDTDKIAKRRKAERGNVVLSRSVVATFPVEVE